MSKIKRSYLFGFGLISFGCLYCYTSNIVPENTLLLGGIALACFFITLFGEVK